MTSEEGERSHGFHCLIHFYTAESERLLHTSTVLRLFIVRLVCLNKGLSARSLQLRLFYLLARCSPPFSLQIGELIILDVLSALLTDKALCLARRKKKKCNFHEDINGCFGERLFAMIVGSIHAAVSRRSELEMQFVFFFDVPASCLQVSVAFVRGGMLHNYLPRNMFSRQ